MPYRIEVSPNNRAGCKNKDCKDAKIKIQKGEIRFGTWVEIPSTEFQSWAWKHWGCVTPAQIAHLESALDGDFEMLDGFDEIPSEDQEKVKRAVKQGHVDDEDWKGDVEYNRPGKKGMHARTPKKKATATDDADQNGAIDETPVKPAKKRGRKVKEEDDEEEAAPKHAKKSKKKATKADTDDTEDAKPASTKSKKAVKAEAEETEDEKPIVKQTKRKSKKKDDVKVDGGVPTKSKRASRGSKKATVKVAESDNEDNMIVDEDSIEQEAESPAPKKAKKSKTTKNVKEKSAVDIEHESNTAKKSTKGARAKKKV